MADRETITAAQLRERFHYDPETGVFTRLERPLSHFPSPSLYRKWNSRWAGTRVGHSSDDYISVHIDGIHYRAHRLAWLYVHGTWPPGMLDHRDMDRTNNRIDNLRLASHSENHANQTARRDNASGFKGVSWHRDRKRWVAQIHFQGKHIHLGLFDTPDEAHAAYVRAATELFGKFARGG